MKFGENLYNLRKSAKISQEKLAEEVGVSRQSVSKWENGESYPEMDNMLKICKIFHCKLNDLVHEDMQDINSLDEEIKMNGVKLEKEKQKRLKVISKIIWVLAKIGKIFSRIAAVAIGVAAIIGCIAVGQINVKDDNSIELNTSTGIIEFSDVDGEIVLNDNSKVQLTNNEEKFNVLVSEDNEKVDVSLNNNDGKIHVKLLNIESKEDLEQIAKIFKRNSKAKVLILVIIASMSAITALILLGITLGHLEKLFKNINEGDTPFTLENVNHIKKISYFMIAVTIAFSISTALGALIFNESASINIGFNVINILFLYSIAIIFEYGYKIQLDSKGKIYDDDNEE